MEVNIGMNVEVEVGQHEHDVKVDGQSAVESTSIAVVELGSILYGMITNAVRLVN